MLYLDTLYTLLLPQLGISAPKESQLQQSRANYKSHAGSFRVSIIHRTLTLTIRSLTCVTWSFFCVRMYTHRGVGHTHADTESAQQFRLGLTLTNFSCAPDVFVCVFFFFVGSGEEGGLHRRSKTKVGSTASRSRVQCPPQAMVVCAAYAAIWPLCMYIVFLICDCFYPFFWNKILIWYWNARPKWWMVPESPNFICPFFFFTRWPIPKGLPFGLCLYVLCLCNVHVL